MANTTLSNAVYLGGLGFRPTIAEAGFSYRPLPPSVLTKTEVRKKTTSRCTFCFQNLNVNVNVWCWLTRCAKTKGFRSEQQLRQTFEPQKRVFREKLTLDMFWRCSKLFPCRNSPISNNCEKGMDLASQLQKSKEKRSI